MFSSSKSSQAAKPQAGASAAGPGLSAQERELVTAESKRLGQKVHQLFNGGNYREALQVAEEQMELLKNAYGPNHHEYATAMNNVATLFQALGRYAEAEPLLLEASRIQGRALGPDHPHTVASLSNLATVYEAMGQAERAAAMHSLVAVHKKTWAEKQKQAQKNR
jgi:tetratricopeptide (TPR) repeat protein